MAMTPFTRSAHPQSRMLLVRCAMIAACGALAAACGSAAAPGSSAAGNTQPSSAHSSTGTQSPATAAKASLDITQFGAGGKVQHWTLRCDPPGGTLRDPAAACTRMVEDKTLFGPRRPGIMCPMIMTNGRRFLIIGTWYGKKVHENIVDGGCDLGHWGLLNHFFN